MNFIPNTTSVNSPDHIYYDLTIKNKISTTTEDTPLTFIETRNTNFLDVASDYYMSILRFSVDTYSIPSYIAEIQADQDDVNKMIQSVSLKYFDGTTYYSSPETFLVWVPVNKSAPTPAAPNTTPDGNQVNSLYYYSYTFNNLVELYNTAFATAMTSLRALVVGGGLASVNAPFISYDSATELFSIHGESPHYDHDTTNRVYVYLNRPAFAHFNTFLSFRYAANAPNGNVYEIRFIDVIGSNLAQYTLYDNKKYIKMTQEVSTINTISPVSSIVFTTSTLPIVPNQLSAPINYVSGQIVNTNYNNQFGLIISDFVTGDHAFKPFVLYQPTSEYRRIDLQGSSPLKTVDINVYFRTKDGQLNPLLMWSGGSCSLKLLFERKIKSMKLIA